MSPKFKILVTDVLGGTSQSRNLNQQVATGAGIHSLMQLAQNRLWSQKECSGLTPGPDSRKLKDCEGCGSSCILYRIIFPETGQASPPLTAGLRIKEEQWQTMYQR
jgi:hypothetical protein